MALTDKLIAIADAIRAKSGKNSPLTLDEMPSEIHTLTTEDIIQHADIPDYVKAEAMEVAQKVQSIKQNDSIVFLAMSDSHYYGTQGESGVDSYVDGNGTQGNISNLHGAMGAKILAYVIGFDFMAHLGDATWGHKTTNSELLNSQVDTLFGMLREAHANLPCFHAIGNHDTGLYYHNEMVSLGNTGVYTEDGVNLYNKFTSLSTSEDTVFGGEEYGGYCYRDFTNKKLRVFLLNTSEYHIYNQTDAGMLGSQYIWFANALLDLNNKTNATEWSYIILCHYPADYGSKSQLSELLKAYVEGGSITISVEGSTSSTVSFNGHNYAKFIAQFHGHVHNFITSRLHSKVTGSPVQFDAWRLCIPNGQYNRENYYTTSVDGINFAEDTSYNKTANTANDTSFVVNVINPTEEKIYSFCYGAGYDRVVGYAGIQYYTISRNFKNVSSNNTDISIEEGETYSDTIIVDSGCDMRAISVTMGGIDISSTSLTVVDGQYIIDVPSVTGNIVITAQAQARPNFTNLVPLSIDSDGSEFYVDGDGYINNTYIQTEGVLVGKNGYVTTGFISFAPIQTNENRTIRIAGDSISTDSEYTRVAFYDSEFSIISYPIALKRFGSSEYYGSLIEEDTTAVTWTLDRKTLYAKESSCSYIRICTKGEGTDFIVTINEEITYGDIS